MQRRSVLAVIRAARQKSTEVRSAKRERTKCIRRNPNYRALIATQELNVTGAEYSPPSVPMIVRTTTATRVGDSLAPIEMPFIDARSCSSVVHQGRRRCPHHHVGPAAPRAPHRIPMRPDKPAGDPSVRSKPCTGCTARRGCRMSRAGRPAALIREAVIGGERSRGVTCRRCLGKGDIRNSNASWEPFTSCRPAGTQQSS
jgi:hypothetical protein